MCHGNINTISKQGQGGTISESSALILIAQRIREKAEELHEIIAKISKHCRNLTLEGETLELSERLLKESARIAQALRDYRNGDTFLALLILGALR